MKIVIVGDGKVGYALTRELSMEGHDIVVIDNNMAVLQKLQESLDVMVVNGNGASLEIQREANVAASDLLIAATSADEINLLCCILAKKLGCKNTIARVRNPEYSQQVLYLREELGLSMTINPERATAGEILRLLQFPSFLKRDTFARGRAELVELKIREDSVLVGIRLDQLYEKAKVKVLVCTVERGDTVTIPSGSFVLKAGDKITVTAANRDLATLIKNLNIVTTKIQNVMIIGGSRTAEYLAEELVSRKIDVKIIEQDHAKCEQLAARHPDVLIINGDGSSQDLLWSEGIDKMDAVITLTGLDEENLIISMYADYMKVPKSITKINRLEYGAMFSEKGIGSMVSPKQLTTNEIVRYVRAMGNTTGGSMMTLYRIVDERAEALEFHVSPQVKNLGVPLYQLSLKENILIAAIIRGGKVIIPKGSDCMLKGDTVLVVALAERAISELNDIFSRDTKRLEE